MYNTTFKNITENDNEHLIGGMIQQQQSQQSQQPSQQPSQQQSQQPVAVAMKKYTENNNKTIEKKDKSHSSILKMNLNKEQYKIINVLIFIFFFCFLMNVLFKILDFYDIDVEQSYSYIIWFSLLFLLFIVLPSKRSVFDDKYKKNDNNTVNNN